MLYRSLFPRDLFNQFDRLQRELQGGLDGSLNGPGSPAIRGIGRGGYPALNVGSTAEAVEVFAFAPGLDPASIDVQLERGVLTLSGQRPGLAPAQASAADERSTLHINERFDGRFRRVISLPDDIDPQSVQASYRDGVLRVSVPRRVQAQPRRIEVQ